MSQQDAAGNGDPPDIIVANGGQLRPFRKGDGRGAAAGRRSAETRSKRRALERAAAADLITELRTLSKLVDRADLGPVAIAAALDMIGRVARGEQAVKDPAEWVRVLVDIARLESGDPTSTSIVAHLGVAEVKALRDQARQTLALTVADPTALAADEE